MQQRASRRKRARESIVNGVLPYEARRADSWGGVLGEKAASPSPAVMGLRERCKLPQRGPGQSPGRSTIFLYVEVEVSRQIILLHSLHY